MLTFGLGWAKRRRRPYSMSSAVRPSMWRLLRGHRSVLTGLAAMALLGGFAESVMLVVIVEAAVALTTQHPESFAVGPISLNGLHVSFLLAVALAAIVLRFCLGLGLAWGSASLTAKIQTELRLALFRTYIDADWPTQSSEREARVGSGRGLQPGRTGWSGADHKSPRSGRPRGGRLRALPGPSASHQARSPAGQRSFGRGTRYGAISQRAGPHCGGDPGPRCRRRGETSPWSRDDASLRLDYAHQLLKPFDIERLPSLGIGFDSPRPFHRGGVRDRGRGRDGDHRLNTAPSARLLTTSPAGLSSGQRAPDLPWRRRRSSLVVSVRSAGGG